MVRMTAEMTTMATAMYLPMVPRARVRGVSRSVAPSIRVAMRPSSVLAPVATTRPVAVP